VAGEEGTWDVGGAAGGSAGGAMGLIPEWHLFTYAPGISALTQTLTVCNPGAIANQANQAGQAGHALTQHGKELVAQGEQTKSFWSGGTAFAAWDATFQVGTAIFDHGNQTMHMASTGLKLANDCKQLVTFVNDGQKQADAVVAVLSKIPYVGTALATAYGIKTYIWTGLCAARLVNIATDVKGLIEGLETKSVEKAYTPPTSSTTTTGTSTSNTPTVKTA
jgi:hypothetical protein